MIPARVKKKGHDYRSQAVYLVCIKTAPDASSLAKVTLENREGSLCALTELTELGKKLSWSIVSTIDSEPGIEVWNTAILPDCAYIILSYQRAVPDDLDTLMCRIMENVGSNLFLNDFTDRVITTTAQLEAFRSLMVSAAREYAIRHKYPTLFDRAQLLDIDGRQFTCFGNFQLLRHPERVPVKISRSYTPDQLAKYKALWGETARGEGVLVSPFVSAAEKQVMADALKSKGRIIRLHPCALTPDYKPEPAELELCRQGRLLIISPTDIPAGQTALNREKCLMLNDLARTLSSQIDSAAVIAGMR